MYGICLAASHKRGLGHLFRMLNFIKYLVSINKKTVVFINDDKNAIEIIKKHYPNLPVEIVDLNDLNSNWEAQLIKKYRVEVWINDRLDTKIEHSKNVKNTGVKLITFDDKGSGAKLSDINCSALIFEGKEKLEGKNILTGIDYLILNDEIKDYKKIRTELKSIIVTLGGSDTYGITFKLVEVLKAINKKITIVIGPSFKDEKKLKEIIDDKFEIKKNVPSLIQEFSKHNLAITGGGITCFEAIKTGLPVLCISSEDHEKQICRYIEENGYGVYLKHRNELDLTGLSHLIYNINIEKLSRNCLNIKPSSAVENILLSLEELN